MRTRLLVVVLVLSGGLHAQNWDEWVRQKKTQKKYLLQQIAALQVYLGYAKEGYMIANKGLTTIGKIEKGDFNLHSEKFASLKIAAPKILSSAKVAEIISRQATIVTESKKTIGAVNDDERFTATEKGYCKGVFDNLLSSCAQLLDELVAVTTAYNLQMSDDERIIRIDALYKETQSQYAFCAGFSGEMGRLSLQRAVEQMEIDFSKKINRK